MPFIPYEDYDEAEGRNLPPLVERLAGPPEEEPLIPRTYGPRPPSFLQVARYWYRRALAAEARLAMYDAREKGK